MKQKVNILIVGNAYSPHISRIIKHIYQNTDLINIDFYNYSKAKEHTPEISEFCNNIYYRASFFPAILYKIPFLNTVLSLLDFKYTIKKKINKSFDFIHIHYITIHSIFFSKLYRRHSKVLVLSAWGSDVLRASPLKIHFMKNLFNKMNYITLSKTGYRDKIQSIFKFPDSKIIDVRIGSEMIDMLYKNQDINKTESKKRLGFEDKYIITIGYNGAKAQNHLNVIEQINLIKDSLPINLFLMLPMTYPSENQEYISEVKSKIEEYNIPYVIYDKYLSNEILLLVRKCTDIFIHAQQTDAAAASVQEYILADSLILNAAWLDYPHLEKFGEVYFTFETFDAIGKKLLYAIKNKEAVKVPEALKIELYNRGWEKSINPWIDFYLNTSKSL